MFTNIKLDFMCKKEAEEVLKKANKVIDAYGKVLLIDFKHLANKPAVYGDFFVEWTNLNDARIIENPDERTWSIILPELKVRA